jgi:isopenicillin N synthase-like dioxygenase
VLPTGKDNIEASRVYVQAQTECAIIILGDSMVKWTNGLLESATHRVTYAAGKQAELARWSLAYLNHSRTRSSMERLEGSHQTHHWKKASLRRTELLRVGLLLTARSTSGKR